MLIDAHAHLDYYRDPEWARAKSEMESMQILTFSVTTSVRDYLRVKRLSSESNLVVPCFGIHPWYAPDFVHNLEALEPFIQETPMIGEIGLDHGFVTDPLQWEAQERLLSFFLAKANDQDKIVNVHMFGAAAEVMECLTRYDVRRAILHWYSGPLDVLAQLADRGCYFTVGWQVVVSKEIQDVARAIPDHLLLTETDNPFAQEGLAGSRGMPNIVHRVIAKMARLRRTTPEEVERLVTANLLALIGDDAGLTGATQLLRL